jgi:carboxyl-terminal processing protease
MRKHKIVVRLRLGRLLFGFLLLVQVFSIQILSLGWFTPPALALTDEQRLLNEAWRIVSQSYVDESFNGQNWWLVRQDLLKQPLPDREATYAAIAKMLASLGDPFTRLLKPSQYRSLQTSTTGELTGIGLQIASDSQSGNLEVIMPIANSPAAQAGLRSRDQILAIDGTPVQKLTLDDAAERLRGPIGSTVELSVRHPDMPATEPAVQVQVTRQRIALNPVVAQLQTQSGGEKLGYIRLNQFNANATTEMSQALRRLESQGASGYILDLRGNPGGLLQSGVDIAELWMQPGPIVYTVDRQGGIGSFNAEGHALTSDPLVVLVNRGTASASEILAGALQDSGRAQLVGEQTFGKGSIQSLFNLSDDSGLAVTIAHYETPSHHDINKVGIKPDRVVALNPISPEQLGTTADTQYQAAVDVLTQMRRVTQLGNIATHATSHPA